MQILSLLFNRYSELIQGSQFRRNDHFSISFSLKKYEDKYIFAETGTKNVSSLTPREYDL